MLQGGIGVAENHLDLSLCLWQIFRVDFFAHHNSFAKLNSSSIPVGAVNSVGLSALQFRGSILGSYNAGNSQLTAHNGSVARSTSTIRNHC